MTVDDALAAVRAGDHGEYRHAIEACEADVRVLMAAMLPDRPLVDECVHEAFVAAYRRLDEFHRGRDEGRAWIMTIARAVAQTARRACLRQEQAKRAYRAEIEAALEPELVARLDRGLGGAIAALATGLGALQAPVREVIHEHYWEGTVPADIARAHERSNAWVRVTLYRARETLVAWVQPGARTGGGAMDRDRLDTLLSGYVGETLTDLEGRELGDLIARDAPARAKLIDQLLVHRLLHESARLPADSGQVLQALSEPPGTSDAVMSRLRAKSAIGREETITDSYRRPAAKASRSLPVVEHRRVAPLVWSALGVAAILAIAYAISRSM